MRPRPVASMLRLIGCGADANSLNKYNASALHCASAEGHTLAALVLLCCGVDAGIVTVYGMTGARCFEIRMNFVLHDY